MDDGRAATTANLGLAGNLGQAAGPLRYRSLPVAGMFSDYRRLGQLSDGIVSGVAWLIYLGSVVQGLANSGGQLTWLLASAILPLALKTCLCIMAFTSSSTVYGGW